MTYEIATNYKPLPADFQHIIRACRHSGEECAMLALERGLEHMHDWIVSIQPINSGFDTRLVFSFPIVEDALAFKMTYCDELDLIES